MFAYLALATPSMNAPFILLLIAAVLVVATAVMDLLAVKRRATSGHTSRASGGGAIRVVTLLPLLCLQLVFAALATLIPLSASLPVSNGIAEILSGGVVALVGVSAGLGIANWRRAHHAPSVSTPPALAAPTHNDAVMRCVIRPTPADVGYRVALLITAFVFALDLIPWALDQVASLPGASVAGGLPGGMGNLLDGMLLGVGVIGLGMLLAVLVTLTGRRALTADAQGLRLRFGFARRESPWSRARRFLVRDHGNGQWSYQLIGEGTRDVIMWPEQPASSRRPGKTLTTSEMAALCIQRSGLRPEFLNPDETDRLIHQRIAATANSISDQAKRLT